MRRARTLASFALISLIGGSIARADDVPPLPAPGKPPVVVRAPVNAPALTGGQWRILAYFDGVAMAVPKLREYTSPPNAGQTIDLAWPTVHFNSDGALNIYAGCGPSGGHYQIADNKVSLQALVVIMGDCGTSETHQVFAIVNAMKATETLVWRGESALLLDHDGNLQLILSR
ncbi:hypothetical protein UAJ10_26155 [Nitrospirillum sp. BR 11164]|uniref:hypothetical protein n=1 Tax=Nitrospirillum sp. BR 11164 TaxID=3104324 RepID=UPI002AFFF209|nr:hypothetical protein [Nitrospirillum sp. BR 11164]MEA1652480.1 hypothetical protein [Nitrospirillum sp. BR 11164]